MKTKPVLAALPFGKIAPARLRQNVAARTAMPAIIADASEEIPPVPPHP